MKRHLPLLAISAVIFAGCLPDTKLKVSTDNEQQTPACDNCTGIVKTDISINFEQIESMIQQADGKLVVAGRGEVGTLYDNNYDMTLARYNTDGTLDTSFSDDGTLTLAIGDGHDWAEAVIQQADGKLVIAGFSYLGEYYKMVVVRFNANGSLDASFGNAGIVTLDIGSRGDRAYALIQQTDGKLVVAGTSNDNGSDDDMALARFNSDGTLDTSFGNNGTVITNTGSSYEHAYALIQQADGKLVIAGDSDSDNGNNYDITLIRYMSDGTLDVSFDSDGIVKTDIDENSNNEHAYSLIQQVNGKLVVAGKNHNGSHFDFAVLRYNSDGSLDSTFDDDGIVTTAVSSYDNMANSVIQQADGKLAVTGEVNMSSGYKYDFALVRYNADGSLDTTLVGDAGTGNGIVINDLGSDVNFSRAVLQQADGKLLVAGNSVVATYEFSLVRYNLDGTLDTQTFGPQ